MFIFNIISKVILKTMVLLSLVLLTLFNSVLKVVIFLFGLVTIPISTLAVILNFALGCTYGFGSENIMLFVAAIILVALKYLFPFIPKTLDSVIFNMKEYLYEPIIVRSPVKYTI